MAEAEAKKAELDPADAASRADFNKCFDIVLPEPRELCDAQCELNQLTVPEAVPKGTF